jgi:hypothetical protein
MANQPPNSTSEADRWVAIYNDLMTCTREVLDRAGDANHLRGSEMSLLEGHLDELAGRLAFWRMPRGSRLLEE